MPVLIAKDSEAIRMQELREKRKLLWERFENNPKEIRLALELKSIDDQIAEYSQQIRRSVSTLLADGRGFEPRPNRCEHRPKSE